MPVAKLMLPAALVLSSACADIAGPVDPVVDAGSSPRVIAEMQTATTSRETDDGKDGVFVGAGYDATAPSTTPAAGYQRNGDVFGSGNNGTLSSGYSGSTDGNGTLGSGY